MKKSAKIILHFAFWFYKILWGPLVGALVQDGELKSITTLIGPFTISVWVLYPIIFYINYFLIMPRYYKKGGMGNCWLAWLTLMGIFIGLRYLIEEVLYLHIWGINNYSEGTTPLYYIYDNLYVGGPVIVMSILFWILDDNLKTKNEKYALLQEKKTAELSFLKNQVNPHFIFNTLNNIYSLVSSNSQKALPAIEKLSQLMRYMYKESGEEEVLLSEELSYLNSYIDLQKIRLNDPGILQYSVPKQTGDLKIAPLILIPFIENIFKHGVINTALKPIEISITLAGNELHLYTCNYINTAVKDESSGVGLANVRKRLQLLYPGKYNLSENIKGETYCNSLTLNL